MINCSCTTWFSAKHYPLQCRDVQDYMMLLTEDMFMKLGDFSTPLSISTPGLGR